MNHLKDLKQMHVSTKNKPLKVMNTLKTDVTSGLFLSIICLFICLFYLSRYFFAIIY